MCEDQILRRVHLPWRDHISDVWVYFISQDYHGQEDSKEGVTSKITKTLSQHFLYDLPFIFVRYVN